MNKNFFLLVVIFVFLGIPLAGAVAQRLHGPQPMMTLSQSVRSNAGFGIAQRGMAGTDESVTVAADAVMPVGPAGKMMGESTIMPPFPGGGGFVANVDRSVVKVANLGLQVEKPAESVQAITKITQENEGLVTSSTLSDYEQDNAGVRADMVVRVPSERLDAVLTAIKAIATRVVTESVNAQDVTEQRVDIDAQLKNLRATEQQFTSILSKAKTVEETLQVQQQLSQTRGQIERLEAQRESLQGSVQMASITVSLSTQADSLPLVEGSELSLKEEIKLALRSSFRLYRGLFIAGVTLLIVALPVIVVAGAGYMAYRKMSKKK